MSLQIATVLEETANNIMTNDTILSLLFAIPCVSLINGKHEELNVRRKGKMVDMVGYSPKDNSSREDETNRDSSCGASKLEGVPDARHTICSKKYETDECCCDGKEPAIIIGNRNCIGEKEAIHIEAKGKEDNWENQHQVDHIADSHHIVK